MSATNKKPATSTILPTKLVADNRRVRHHYELIEILEAGIVLRGPEVKSVRHGHLSLTESYCRITANEIFLMGAHIAPYEHGGYVIQDPIRPRKLLLNKKQNLRLYGRTRERGWALVPVKAYFLKGKLKLQIALAKGKKEHDKREALKQRQMQREAQQALQQHSQS